MPIYEAALAHTGEPSRGALPLGHAGKAIRRLLDEGQSVVLVREGEQNLERVRERVPIYRFEAR